MPSNPQDGQGNVNRKPPVTRVIDMAIVAKEAWGDEYTKPDPAYEFTGRTFVNTDRQRGGPYQGTGS